MGPLHYILPVVENLTSARIVCIGDVMLDQFIYGSVERVSPEAPIPVLSIARRNIAAGGVGNVAANLSGLGCAVELISVAGDDDAHDVLEKVLKDLPGLQATLLTDPSRPTTEKTRFIAGHQQMLRADLENVTPIAPAVEDALIAAAKKAFKNCQCVVLSDYGKGVLTPKVLRAVMDAARSEKIPVFVDPKGSDYAKYKGARLITPNRKELELATGLPASSDADIVAAARALMTSGGIGGVIATRSADGMTVLDGTSDPVHLRTQAREVFDVSGAGDTVIAVLAAAVASGASILDAAALANIAAGIVVEKVGTAAIRAEDLRRFLAENNFDARQTIAPVLSWEGAREQIERWRARGLRVGFTNGCFDLVHQGHVVMLDRCRAQCDKLILGLNADASVTRLKGASRPVNKQDARAQVIAALGSVDAVVVFGEEKSEKDTPLDLIKALKPDFLFKGADYTADSVVGGDFVQSYGGKIVLIPLEEGFSTTDTIKKLGSAA